MSVADDTFAKAFLFTWAHEKGPGSGKVDDPVDKGGRTNCGVTQRRYDPSGSHDVWLATPEELKEIYHEEWLASQGTAVCDVLPELAIANFDTWFMMRPTNAIKILQRTVSAKPDGSWGGMTWAAIRHTLADVGPYLLIKRYCVERRNFHRQVCLADTTQLKFLPGWLRRVNDLEMTLTMPPPAPPVSPSPPVPD